MQLPMPVGTPMPLPAQVAGSLSRMQGLLQAAQPEIQTAYATHWLAARQASGVPAFQALTQQMLWGLYGTTALSGLLRFALSGRATPEVMGGIIDQANLIQQSYAGATGALRQFLEQPEAADFPAVPTMVRAMTPLDRVHQAMQAPVQTVLTGLPWVPGVRVPGMPLLQQANLQWVPEGGTPGPAAPGPDPAAK